MPASANVTYNIGALESEWYLYSVLYQPKQSRIDSIG